MRSIFLKIMHKHLELLFTIISWISIEHTSQRMQIYTCQNRNVFLVIKAEQLNEHPIKQFRYFIYSWKISENFDVFNYDWNGMKEQNYQWWVALYELRNIVFVLLLFVQFNKKALYLKEKKDGYLGGVGWRKEKEKVM